MKQPLSAWKISEIMAVELWCLKGKSMGKSIIVEVLMETHDIYTVYTCGKHALLSNVHINGLLHSWENHHHHHFIIEVNGENMASTKGLLKHPSCNKFHWWSIYICSSHVWGYRRQIWTEMFTRFHQVLTISNSKVNHSWTTETANMCVPCWAKVSLCGNYFKTF